MVLEPYHLMEKLKNIYYKTYSIPKHGQSQFMDPSSNIKPYFSSSINVEIVLGSLASSFVTNTALSLPVDALELDYC